MWSKRIVGYCIDKHMKTPLVTSALFMTLPHRGCMLNAYSLQGSMGGVGACEDNAAMESFSLCHKKC